jgi:PAS domain S-box-containing protein
VSQSALIPLINNAALLVAMVLVYEVLSARLPTRKNLLWQVISGLLLGMIGMAVMLNSWQLAPGVIYDTRSVVLALSGLFFGTVPTLLAVLLTGALRIMIGGGGAPVGVAVIVCSAGIGLLWRYLRKRELRALSFGELYLLGLAVHFVMIGLMLLLPQEARGNFFAQAALPVMLIYPLATALAGWAMVAREARRHLEKEKEKAEETLRRNEARLRSLVELLQYQTRDLQDFLALTLEKAIELTGSKLGYIFTYDEEKKRLIPQAWSKGALEETKIPNPPYHFDPEKSALLGEPVRQGKPLILNDYQAPHPLKKGYPEGHVEIRKFLSVPVFKNGKIVALIGLANKETDYEEADVLQIRLLMEAVWRTLERRQVEEALEESQAYFEIALQAAGMGVWRRDLAQNRFFFSDYALKLLGIDPEKFRGTVEEFLAAVHPEDRERLRAFMASVAELDQPFDQEYRVLWADGSVRFIRARGRVMRDEKGQPVRVMGVLWDVTELRRKETEVERARADFLLSVSHELKTPLFLMAADLELLKSRPPEERLRQLLSMEETFSRNLMRLRFLVENLIDSQRAATMGMRLNLVKADLNSLVKSAVEELEIPMRKQNIELKLDLKPLPSIDLDQEAITRVLQNLLTNAFKFSPPGGTVEIRTRSEEDLVILEVQDYGPGIPQENISYLFQPFSRTQQAMQSVIPGTGLGLYVSRILIEAHGGTISLSSGEGKGTTVTVRLPVKGGERRVQ